MLERRARWSGAFERASHAWLQWSGVDAANLQGLKWLRFVHAADRALVYAQWDDASESGKPFELRYRFCNGASQRMLLERATPIAPGVGWRVQGHEVSAGLEVIQLANAPAPALVEFDTAGQVAFATREAQALLGFGRVPLWGAGLNQVLARFGAVAHAVREDAPPVLRPSATEAALGALRSSITLQGNGRALTLRFRGTPAPVVNPALLRADVQRHSASQ